MSGSNAGKNLIMEDNREYYQYAMELLVEESLTVGTILVVIICMQEFVNGVIFLISFLALRRRTGGFHMKTFKACYVATIGTFIGVLLVKILCIHIQNCCLFLPV